MYSTKNVRKIKSQQVWNKSGTRVEQVDLKVNKLEQVK